MVIFTKWRSDATLQAVLRYLPLTDVARVSVVCSDLHGFVTERYSTRWLELGTTHIWLMLYANWPHWWPIVERSVPNLLSLVVGAEGGQKRTAPSRVFFPITRVLGLLFQNPPEYLEHLACYLRKLDYHGYSHPPKSVLFPRLLTLIWIPGSSPVLQVKAPRLRWLVVDSELRRRLNLSPAPALMMTVASKHRSSIGTHHEATGGPEWRLAYDQSYDVPALLKTLQSLQWLALESTARGITLDVTPAIGYFTPQDLTSRTSMAEGASLDPAHPIRAADKPSKVRRVWTQEALRIAHGRLMAMWDIHETALPTALKLAMAHAELEAEIPAFAPAYCHLADPLPPCACGTGESPMCRQYYVGGALNGTAAAEGVRTGGGCSCGDRLLEGKLCPGLWSVPLVPRADTTYPRRLAGVEIDGQLSTATDREGLEKWLQERVKISAREIYIGVRAPILSASPALRALLTNSRESLRVLRAESIGGRRGLLCGLQFPLLEVLVTNHLVMSAAGQTISKDLLMSPSLRRVELPQGLWEEQLNAYRWHSDSPYFTAPFPWASRQCYKVLHTRPHEVFNDKGGTLTMLVRVMQIDLIIIDGAFESYADILNAYHFFLSLSIDCGHIFRILPQEVRYHPTIWRQAIADMAIGLPSEITWRGLQRNITWNLLNEPGEPLSLISAIHLREFNIWYSTLLSSFDRTLICTWLTPMHLVGRLPIVSDWLVNQVKRGDITLTADWVRLHCLPIMDFTTCHKHGSPTSTTLENGSSVYVPLELWVDETRVMGAHGGVQTPAASAANSKFTSPLWWPEGGGGPSVNTPDWRQLVPAWVLSAPRR